MAHVPIFGGSRREERGKRAVVDAAQAVSARAAAEFAGPAMSDIARTANRSTRRGAVVMPAIRTDAKRRSRPVSRVLSRTVIPLGSPSPATSSGLPGSTGGHPLPLAGRLPYLALLQVGFAMPSLLPSPRCALTAPFHPYRRHFWRLGGLFSVALSVGSRRPGVTWHLVRRSPDFPPHFARNAATIRPTPGRTIASWKDHLKRASHLAPDLASSSARA